jgi:NAD-dependent deacetylase
VADEPDADVGNVGHVAAALGAAKSVVALTGAGISAESGVPTFRGAAGLWREYHPEDLATPDAFRRDPRLVWEWYLWRRRAIAHAQPNRGHLVLARFERALPGFTLLTQNVDGLHQRAGSQRPIELHGNIWTARCTRCGSLVDQGLAPGADADTIPLSPADLPACDCGALLRPDVVWFGEALDPDRVDRASAASRACDLMLVIGTSAIVYPVAGFPALARAAGAMVVEINVDATPLTGAADVVLRGASGRVLPALERAL